MNIQGRIGPQYSAIQEITVHTDTRDILSHARRAALRRGLQDRLLLRELEGCGGGDSARRIARRVVPRALGEASATPAWPALEPEWDAARRELLDAIEVACHDDAELDR